MQDIFYVFESTNIKGSERPPRRLDRLIDYEVGMRDADKPCLELRGRKINAFGKHRVEKPAVHVPVALDRKSVV